MIGLPLSAGKLSLPCPGCAISTDGSFWNIAATTRNGMFSLTKFSAMKLLEAMSTSSRPASRSCVWFTLGPPWRMVTSSPWRW